MIDEALKRGAGYAVARAIRSGELVRQPCSRCDTPKAVAHHEDYSRPLDVVWLCIKCHWLRHRERGDLRGQLTKEGDPILSRTVQVPGSFRQKLRLLAAAKGTTSIGELRAALDAHFEREWPQVRARMDAA